MDSSLGYAAAVTGDFGGLQLPVDRLCWRLELRAEEVSSGNRHSLAQLKEEYTFEQGASKFEERKDGRTSWSASGEVDLFAAAAVSRVTDVCAATIPADDVKWLSTKLLCTGGFADEHQQPMYQTSHATPQGDVNNLHYQCAP